MRTLERLYYFTAEVSIIIHKEKALRSWKCLFNTKLGKLEQSNQVPLIVYTVLLSIYI